MSISVELVFKQMVKLDCAECFSFIMHCPSVAILHVLSGSNWASETYLWNERLLEEKGFSPVAGRRQWEMRFGREWGAAQWELRTCTFFAVSGRIEILGCSWFESCTCRVHLFSMWDGGIIEPFAKGWEKFFNTETR